MNMFLGKIMELVFVIILGVFFVRVVQEIMKQGWVARTFDFNAFFYISIPNVALFLVILPSDTNAHSLIEIQAILFGMLLGFPVLIKRLSVMQEQAEKSQQQIDIAQKQSRDSQYRDARNLLQSNQLNSRMMGIADLWRFAKTHPQEEYHTVMDVFINFIHQPIPYEWKEGTHEQDKKASKRRDIRKILQYMGAKRLEGAKFYKIDLREAHLEDANLRQAYLAKADLRGAYLEGANLRDARLEEANLIRAHLKGADLWQAYLEGADLRHSNLEDADLWDAVLLEADLRWSNLVGTHLERACLNYAHLEGADLRDANLKLALINNADFAGAKNLTQEQIDSCVFITDDDFSQDPPTLPEGMEHTYIEMEQDEWEEER